MVEKKENNMNLINKEAVVDAIYKRDDRLQKCEAYRNKADRIDLLGVLPEINTIPPAFEGMTNGEVIQAVFDVMVLTVKDGKVWVEKIYFPFDEVWWNSPCQKGGE